MPRAPSSQSLSRARTPLIGANCQDCGKKTKSLVEGRCMECYGDAVRVFMVLEGK